LVRDGALHLPEHQTNVGDAHLGDREGREDTHARGVGEDGEEIRKIGDHFVLRQIVSDDAFVVLRQRERRSGISFHLFIIADI